MSWLSLLLYHIILLDVALALSLAGNNGESKEPQVAGSTLANVAVTDTSPTTTTATQMPAKAEGEENHEKTDDAVKEKETIEKPLPKKRGILDELYRSQPVDFDEKGMDANDEPAPEELLSYSHPELEERPFFRFNDHRDSAFANNGGYFENDGRRKRTAMLDGMYNRPQEYSNSEIEISPEEVMALLRLLEERRLHNPPAQSPWSDYDNTIDSIEADMRDEDAYRERPGNRYGDTYNSNFDNVERYPAGMKRYMITRRRRSDFLGNPKLKVPVFRRAILK